MQVILARLFKVILANSHQINTTKILDTALKDLAY